ncbi:MAG TPA: hypothetical protein VJ917_07130 [Saprospiraceae bacterium]|nr:hypothetical protein [Saprospiraceae bacterium]
MILDSELEAMVKSHDAMKELREEEKRRVIEWLIKKYGLFDDFNRVERLELGGSPSTEASEPAEEKESKPFYAEHVEDAVDVTDDLTSFNNLAQLMKKVKIKTEPEKALVGAAYLQAGSPRKALSPRAINKELKYAGKPCSNITTSLASLVKKGALEVKKASKSSKSKRSTKTYKVTKKGMQVVESAVKSGKISFK